MTTFSGLRTRRTFVTTIFTLFLAFNAAAWSSKGHLVTASLAQRHMTTTTYQSIREVLDGDNIVYWASWLDSARNEDAYAYTSTWHYINVNADETYETRYHEPAGDAVSAIIWAYSTLEEEGSSKENKALALKVITHCVGDLHQPLHSGHKTDLGGNTIYIYYKGERKSLHSIWDYNLVEDAHPDWNYYQWSQNINNLSAEEETAITEGSIDDWARECVSVASEVYEYFPKNKRVDDADLVYWTPRIEQQFQRGGLRLAYLLNNVFDPGWDGISLPTPDMPACDQVDVYSISGVCIMRATDRAHAISNLAPGLYIISGHKVAITH